MTESSIPSHLIDDVADTTAHKDREVLDHSVSRLLFQFLGARSVALYRVVHDGRTARHTCNVRLTRDNQGSGVACADDPSDSLTPGEHADWEACVATGGSMEEIQSDGSCKTVFPIESEREVNGLLEIHTDVPVSAWDATLVRGILRVFKNHLAILDYSERDTLTGLLNRKTFEAQFEKLCARLRNTPDPSKRGQPSWLGALDIDHFKAVNDRYGHLFGDEVLLLVSQIVGATLRGTDQVFRFGGEEFLIVLPRVAQTGAATAFERVRAAVAAHAFPQVGNVTVSLGYTEIQPGDIATTCIARADGALYYTKRNGRNAVYHYETLTATGELASKENTDGSIELF